MKTLILGIAALSPLLVTREAAPPAPPVHCQVPCGIYGDKMRIDMLMEDAATVEKAMTSLVAMDAEENPSKNQMVRWVVEKESHAQKIQDQVATYWLAQRIKVPGADAGPDAVAKYHGQLGLLHRITVAAMKCKQTTDTAHVASLRALAVEFSGTYFTGADLEHIRGEHGGGEHGEHGEHGGDHR